MNPRTSRRLRPAQTADAPVSIQGVGISPGTALAPALVVPSTAVAGPPRRSRTTPESEHDRLGDALVVARRQLSEAVDRMDRMGGSQAPGAQILRAHLALLADPGLIDEIRARIDRDGIRADEALEKTMAALVARFQALREPVLRARADDIRDVCDLIARSLQGTPRAQFDVHGPTVVCGDDLMPSEILQLARDSIVAFVLGRGSETSHAAMLMRSLSVPVVIQAVGLTSLVRDGDQVLVDGTEGRVVIRPDSATRTAACATVAQAPAADCAPAVTRDGTRVVVMANVSNLGDAKLATAAGADGVGLFRTEFLFLAHESPPSGEEQRRAYEQVLHAFGSHRVTVRALDLGGDKHAPWLQRVPEANPALGVRGIRLLLAREELLAEQVRALLRASRGGLVRLLLPMITDVSEVRRARHVVRMTAQELGTAYAAARIEIGAMVETPAAALLADELAQSADFLSLGTNDLAQYVLAVDRLSAEVASRDDAFHPAVVRLIRHVAAAAARHGRPIGICGELASDPAAIPLLVGAGIRELSVRPAAVARVKAIVRRLSAHDAALIAEEVCALDTAAAIVERLRRFVEMEVAEDVRAPGHDG